MKNLVGPEDVALWPAILATPGLIPHLYGKAEARPGRKMGHVTRLFPGARCRANSASPPRWGGWRDKAVCGYFAVEGASA